MCSLTGGSRWLFRLCPYVLIPFTWAAKPSLRAQQPEIPKANQESGVPLTLSVSSRLVVLDVSATDSQGRPVTDLRREDFRVREDNEPQSLRYFEPPASHQRPRESDGTAGLPVRSSADLSRIGNAPLTVIVLDEANMAFEDEAYARGRLERWVRAQPALLRQPILLTALTYTDFRVLLDTTQDRDRVLAVLNEHTTAVPWRHENVGTVGGAASDMLAGTLGALEQIATSMAGLPGRKNVLWLGDGFPSVRPTDISSGASRQLFEQIRHVDQELYRSHVALSVLGSTIKPPNHPTNLETLSDVLVNAVQFAKIDPQGSIAFANLAAPTGGKSYAGRNDLDAELEEATVAGSSYYTLMYTPTNNRDDLQRYRKITVEVLRPRVVLQTRDGYFPTPVDIPTMAPSAVPRQRLAFDLYGAANSRLPYTDLHLLATRLGTTRWVVRVRATDVKWTSGPDNRRKAEDVVLAACFDRKDRMIGHVFHEVGSDTTANEVQLLGRQIPLDFTLAVPPETARIRFVVRDNGNGRVGTVDAPPTGAQRPAATP